MKLRLNPLAAAILLLLPSLLPPRAQGALPFTLQGPGVDPGQFRVTSFATGLDYPLGMDLLPDGSLAVLVNVGNGFYGAPGQILRFTDLDGDGVADAAGQVLHSGLPNSQTALRRAGNLLLVSGLGSSRLMTVFRIQSGPPLALALVGTIELMRPSGSWLHPQSALAVRTSPADPSQHDVVFQLGSDTNFKATTRTATLSSSTIAGASGTVKGDSIYRITLSDDGTRVTASDLTQLATGLRNAAGIAFHPVTGDLYFQDNGIDGVVDANEPTSADELNVIRQPDIGGSIEDFGFPSAYVEYRTGSHVGTTGIPPLMAFVPIPSPATGAEAEGANDIAFAPPGFPEALSQGMFIGFHGKFNQGGLANEENPLVYADLQTGGYFHFIGTREPAIGHLDGLLSTEDSLFAADLSPPGSVSAGRGRGVVYQIKSLAPPRMTFAWRSGTLELTWSHGRLQTAEALGSGWTDEAAARSPYRVPPAGRQGYFRVLAKP